MMHWARFTWALFSEYCIYSFEKISMLTGNMSSLLNFVGIWPVHLLTAILQFHTYSDSLSEFSIFIHWSFSLEILATYLQSLKARRRVWRVEAKNYDTNFRVYMITNRPGHVVPHWKGLKNAVCTSPLSLSLWTHSKPNSYPHTNVTLLYLPKNWGNHMFLSQTDPSINNILRH